MTEITVSGLCHNVTLAGPVEDREAWVTSQRQPLHAEGSLVLGRAAGATGTAHLDCDDPAFWDQVAAHASQIASWLRSQAGEAITLGTVA